jgi:hypothetical protein
MTSQLSGERLANGFTISRKRREHNSSLCKTDARRLAAASWCCGFARQESFFIVRHRRPTSSAYFKGPEQSLIST